MNDPLKDVLRLPLEKRAEMAFKVAVAKAIEEDARLGLPSMSGAIVKWPGCPRTRFAIPQDRNGSDRHSA
jgi:hypothetical protein